MRRGSLQRRLTAALVGLALAAVLLVGVGVLVISSIGARSDARISVKEQLDAFADVVDQLDTPLGGAGLSIERFAQTFGGGDVGFVSISDSGIVGNLAERQTPRADRFTLDADVLAALSDNGEAIFDRGGNVTGLLLVSGGDTPQADGQSRAPRLDRQLALLVDQRVARVPRQAFSWFLLSALAVLALSIAVGSMMARRIVAPVRAIEQATARIAQGDLDSKVEVRGTDEIAQLATAVNQMADDLGRSRDLERQFLMSVSHDLRTPLTSIRGYAEALIDGATDDAPAAGAVIVRNTDRLDRLVRDLLDLAKLDARAFAVDLHPIDASSVARASVDSLRPFAEQNGLALVVEGGEPQTVVADRDRLGQVINNLIENGVKFARSSVNVAVSSSADQVIISVSDDGPGIPEADLPHVFERLYVTQLKPLRAEQSSGLGLSIVRELTSAMGGEVSVASSPSGSTFTLTFPAPATP